MKVYYDESPAGAGKTERAVLGITRSKCKALIVTERKESFPELRKRIVAFASQQETHPSIRLIHGETDNSAGSVAKEVENLPTYYSDVDHVIVIITHSALLQSDFSGFSGWRIVIDEVPAFLNFEEKATHLDAPYFSRHYALRQVSDLWYAVEPTPEGANLTPADVRADDSHNHLGVFHSRILEAARPNATRYVLCNLPQWSAMEKRKVKWCWASTFSLRELAAFDHVELLGNRFRSDVGSHLSRFFDIDDVEWVELPPLPTRSFATRRVHISYFSDQREASKSLFQQEGGQVTLRAIGVYLRSVLTPRHSIWSANDVSERDQPSPKECLGLPSNDYLKPKQAGTNEYMGFSQAAMIYAAKPSSNLRSLLNACEIDPSLWTRSVEHETILQFVTRTSVRDPNSTAPVHLYVFDRAQAEYLLEYFAALPHVSATTSHVSLEVDVPSKQKVGRPRKIRTPEEQVVWENEKRLKDRDRKRAVRKKAA